MSSPHHDVVVVGGGLAGLCAATAAVEAGADTLLLEAGHELGGSTRTLGGVVYAAGTPVQAAAGITDTPQDLYSSYLLLNQYHLEPGILRVLVESARDALAWLTERGVEFPPSDLYSAMPGDPGRSHRATGRGAGLVDPLAAHLRTTTASIRTGARVTGLLHEHDRVRGVRIGDEAVEADAVVLATGGYGNAPGLVERFYPSAAALGDELHYVGAGTNRGEGISMGLDLGAQFAGADRGLLLLAPGHATVNEPVLPASLLLLNQLGHRFTAEDLSYAVTPAIVAAQPGGTAWAVFDDRTRTALPTHVSGHGQSAWSPEVLGARSLPAGTFRAGSLPDLAALTGMPEGALAQAVARYNELCRQGTDLDWEKRSEHLRAVVEPPFHAVLVRPRVLVLTSGGLRIDAGARVLDGAGSPVPGLFAAGETTGGVMGSHYVGGLVNTSSAVFGILAGTHAAR